MCGQPKLTHRLPPGQAAAGGIHMDDSLIEPLTILLSQPGGKGAVLAAISENISLLIQLGPDGELGPRPFPIRFQAQVALTRHGAVIRLAFAFYDRPDSPLVTETFVDIEDTKQREMYEQLCRQNALLLYFFAGYTLVGAVSNPIGDARGLRSARARALQHNATLPHNALNFTAARFEHCATTPLERLFPQDTAYSSN